MGIPQTSCASAAIDEPIAFNAFCAFTVSEVYDYGLYRRERVLAVAETPGALVPKERWDETVHGYNPAPGSTA